MSISPRLRRAIRRQRLKADARAERRWASHYKKLVRQAEVKKQRLRRKEWEISSQLQALSELVTQVRSGLAFLDQTKHLLAPFYNLRQNAVESLRDAERVVKRGV